ncbi:unnamed protein product [Ilex paraguariensis]
MVLVGSDGEDERRPTGISKRIKFPKKYFDDCNTVDHASVPRKLRSAMKKRNRESDSPPLPDSNKTNNTVNGVELIRKDDTKRSKLNMQGDSGGSPSHATLGPITKDEEEVVETLYALAGMFPDTDKSDGTKLDDGASEAKAPVLLETENCKLASKVSKEQEEIKTFCSTASGDVTKYSTTGEAVKVQSLNETSLPTLPSKQLAMEFDNYVPRVDHPLKSLLCGTELSTERLSCNSLVFGGPSELNLNSRIKQPEPEGTSVSGRKVEIAFGQVTALGHQHGQQNNITESTNNDSGLWPGLSSTGGLAQTQEPSLQSSTAKLPAWLGNATCATRLYLSNNVPITEKNDRVSVNGKKSCKRGSAHVYISHLIKAFQTTERKDSVPMRPTQLIADEGSKQGAVIAVNNPNGVKNGFNGVVANRSIVCAAAEKNPSEVRNAILLHKKLLQDQRQASTISGLYNPNKQSIDFLSLSAGGCGVEAHNNTNKSGIGMEPLTQVHVPYLQPRAQSHMSMPFSMPSNRHSSDLFSDHLSAAAAQQVHMQLPQYLGSTFCSSTHLGATASPNQQQLQWTQLTSEYKLGGVAGPYIPNWQNGGQDSPSLIQYAHAIFPHPRSSLDLLGPKYAPILPQQQQQLIAVNTSLPPAKVKRQHHPLPHGPGYEGNGGGFHPGRAPSMQLLCDEHI